MGGASPHPPHPLSRGGSRRGNETEPVLGEGSAPAPSAPRYRHRRSPLPGSPCSRHPLLRDSDSGTPLSEAPRPPTMILRLLLEWLVATATVTPVPEVSPNLPKLLLQPPLVTPYPAPDPPGDVRGLVLPEPGPPAGMASPSPPGTPEEPVTTANSSTPEPPGTPSPPCPGDDEPAVACGETSGEQQAAVAEAVGAFTLRFYQHMAAAAQPGTNLLFSPINVAMGLAHLLLGARGETRDRLATVLGLPPEPGCLHSALRQLATAPGLFSATQIFHQPGLRLRPRFLNQSWHFYGARPSALSGNETLDLLQVNQWVWEASGGLLPELLPAMPPQAQLLLLSAVHLRAAWHVPLDPEQTVPLPFLRPGRPRLLVPTMTSKKYPVGSFTDRHLQAQVGRLELSGGLSLVVLVPWGPLGSLGALERALDPPTFLGLLRRAAHTPLRPTALALPRLRLDTAIDVVALVHDMDFGLFLDAELCGLAWGPGVAVDTARHRAVLVLDEAGVEAAGAMATSVARSALLLEALRPFLFILWHDNSSVPLFMGRLSNPQP
ncbi:plasma protease C1 inhibitor isoform X1 [Heliangelus exortis]|uniref:plasma protease C1 inhibitor isoform X1 n=2 Tax=Heliangelus exortis TaxID=472823 RepID=UPI003A9214B1